MLQQKIANVKVKNPVVFCTPWRHMGYWIYSFLYSWSMYCKVVSGQLHALDPLVRGKSP